MRSSQFLENHLRSLLERIAGTEIFVNCARKLRDTIGADSRLVSHDAWPPSKSDGCRNPLCELLLQRDGNCSACERFLNSSSCEKLGGPRPIECLGGVVQLSARIWARETPVGYLILDPVVICEPQFIELERLLSVSRELDPACTENQLATIYAQMVRLSARNLLPTVNMLALCAEQLSELAGWLVPTQPSSEAVAVHRARIYIEQHYARKLTIKAIAQAAGLSTFHFCRVFKRVTSCTPIEYLNRLRVQRAQLLLMSREYRSNEVAYAVGFTSVSHFNRIFKQVSKTSPSEYREGQRALACMDCALESNKFESNENPEE